jgi:hypothetical protein
LRILDEEDNKVETNIKNYTEHKDFPANPKPINNNRTTDGGYLKLKNHRVKSPLVRIASSSKEVQTNVMSVESEKKATTKPKSRKRTHKKDHEFKSAYKFDEDIDIDMLIQDLELGDQLSKESIEKIKYFSIES